MARRSAFLVAAVLLAPIEIFGQSLTLATPFSGTSTSDGAMFDLRASSTIVIRSFDLHLAPGTWDVHIYAVALGGSWQGNEANPAA